LVALGSLAIGLLGRAGIFDGAPVVTVVVVLSILVEELVFTSGSLAVVDALLAKLIEQIRRAKVEIAIFINPP
jgi:hypothetical protein